jgi:hypothetical protein
MVGLSKALFLKMRDGAFVFFVRSPVPPRFRVRKNTDATVAQGKYIGER